MKHGSPDLDTAIATGDQFDHHELDWSRIQCSTYLIHQHLRYDYPGPIHNLEQHLIILPPHHYGNQHLLDHRLTVTNQTVQTMYRSDSFGNTEIVLFVPYVEKSIDFEAWILIERHAKLQPLHFARTSSIVQRFLQPSRLTQPDDTLREVAHTLQASGRQGLALAQHINEWVYHTIHYTHDATDIHTTATQALVLKQGVCQDYAHIMLTLCRLCALPARYISGHMLGEGGTHAWVEALVPDQNDPDTLLAIPLDPTHGRAADIGYLTIAIGSDYFDVAPTSGTFRAAYSGHLSAHKTVGLSTYEYADTIKLDDTD
jgi:transglutaminase-like putative cysteine protease